MTSELLQKFSLSNEKCPETNFPLQVRGMAYLHSGNDKASVHDELAEGCRPLVAVAPMDHEQPADVLELGDGEVGRQGSLLPLLGGEQGPPRSMVRIKPAQEKKAWREPSFLLGSSCPPSPALSSSLSLAPAPSLPVDGQPPLPALQP